MEARRLAGSCCADSSRNDSGMKQNDGIEDRSRPLPTFHAACGRVFYQKSPAATKLVDGYKEHCMSEDPGFQS